MSILNPLSWFRGAPPEQKASAAGGAISAWHVGNPVWTPRDYSNLTRESYRLNPVAFRCVKKISTAAAGVPWLLHDARGNEIEQHPVLTLLNRPSPAVGGFAFFEALYAYLLLSGNSYVEGVGPDSKPPRELWNLRPDRTRVVAGPYGLPSGFEYEANGRTLRWSVNPLDGRGPILHIKEFNPLDDWYGMSRVEAAAYGVDRHNAAAAHNKALLDNGARPSGALIFKPIKVAGIDGVQSAPPAAIEAAEKALRKRHAGPDNAGRPMVLGGDVAWESMGMTPVDMDFDNSKDDAARDICIAWGVPHVLIVKGQSTYNNLSEAKLELYEETVLPLMDLVTDELNTWLAPQFGDGLRLTPNLDEIPALETRRISKRTTTLELFDKGLLDSAEAREALQYGPRDPASVMKVDASVLTALVNGIETIGMEPLARYMIAVGLVAPGTTPEAIVDAAQGLIEDETEEDDEEEDEDGNATDDGGNDEDED